MMNFIEWLKDEERECARMIWANENVRPINPADLVSIVNRRQKISAALSLYNDYEFYEKG